MKFRLRLPPLPCDEIERKSISTQIRPIFLVFKNKSAVPYEWENFCWTQHNRYSENIIINKSLFVEQCDAEFAKFKQKKVCLIHEVHNRILPIARICRRGTDNFFQSQDDRMMDRFQRNSEQGSEPWGYFSLTTGFGGVIKLSKCTILFGNRTYVHVFTWTFVAVLSLGLHQVRSNRLYH